MTLYLNLRTHAVGGSVADPYVLEGAPEGNPPALRSVGWAELASLSGGKNVVFATHGFNVSYADGVRCLGRLEPLLGLGASDVFLGVLWPGDWWLPVVNYPFEGGVAMDSGRRVAAFCRRWMASAQNFSFISHSLGARVILEAVENLDRRARVVCLTAAAVHRNCLDTDYASAASNAAAVSILASHSDWVLRVAFEIGDPIADVLHDDHTPFQKALGYDGPPVPARSPISSPWQISDAANYGHSNYLPPSTVSPVGDRKWLDPAGFMARALRGQPQTWP
jgi:hypothetical protein